MCIRDSPEGLAGDAIPISARLMALADVFDALIARRAYKAPMPFERAVAIIREGRDTHFDPAIVDAFLARLDEFASIAESHADSDVESLVPIERMSGSSLRET